VISKFDDMQEFIDAVGNCYSNKNKKDNSLNLLYFCLNTPGTKLTVEFRQQSSVERIIHCIKIIVAGGQHCDT
jgi:hypothetical protein